MSSSVFYKFKNSREPTPLFFDGTSIDVWSLKKEIIAACGMGDGSDFNLHMYPQEDLNAEYKDDTTLIPRSATVVCVRRPAPRGQGRAARYVSGKPPVRAIVKEPSRPTAPLTSAAAAPGAPLSEADAEAAFLAESAQVWDAQKATLSHAKPVYNKSRKPVTVPNHEPPTGYVCKRCLIKGHWVQACPTNEDPDFKPVFQAKRTTGIPRSFLKTVEKPVDEEAAKGIMLNADGEYVQVMADTKTWEKFQEKAQASKARAASAEAADNEIRERGLECPIDKRRFIDPVKTPCCSKTYCRECIDNALAEGDLVCPNCGKEEVLMDDLESDDVAIQALKAFDSEKAAEKEAKVKDDAPNEAQLPSTIDSNDTSALSKPNVAENGNDSDTSATSKKRKSPPTTIMPPTAPKAMRQANPAPSIEQNFIAEMEALKNGQPPSMAMPMQMGFPPQMGFNGPPMGFNMPFNQQQQQQFGPQMGYGMPMMPNHMQFQGFQGNQGQQSNDAYERQPVNNRNRNRRARAPDYRYL